MKLKQIKHDHNYQFLLTFANQETAKVDLEKLISKYVNPEEIETARVNQHLGKIGDVWNSKMERLILSQKLFINFAINLTLIYKINN